MVGQQIIHEFQFEVTLKLIVQTSDSEPSDDDLLKSAIAKIKQMGMKAVDIIDVQVGETVPMVDVQFDRLEDKE